MSTSNKSKVESENDVEKIVSNPLFSIYGRKRKTPNEFTEMADAMANLKMEIINELRIPQFVEWLSKKLKKRKKL